MSYSVKLATLLQDVHCCIRRGSSSPGWTPRWGAPPTFGSAVKKDSNHLNVQTPKRSRPTEGSPSDKDKKAGETEAHPYPALE